MSVTDPTPAEQAAGARALLLAAGLCFALAPLALPISYDWVEHGISDSAAQGVEGAWVARLGFIAFGLAVLVLTVARRREWGPIGMGLHLTFAVSMFAVAAFSARSWVDASPYVAGEDSLHSFFAGVMGFAFVAGVVAVMVARRLSSFRAVVPDVAMILVATAVPLAMSAGVWGLLQRVMFAAALLWYARESVLLTASGDRTRADSAMRVGPARV